MARVLDKAPELKLALLFARILVALLVTLAKPETCPHLPGIQKSIAYTKAR